MGNVWLSMKRTRFAWHVHHDTLVESLTEPLSRRIAYIKNEKPKSEQALRLRLLKAVRGKLPKKYVEAWQARDQAWQAYVQAWQARDQAWQAYVQAWQAYEQAQQAYEQAGQAYEQAQQAYEQAQQALNPARQAYEQAWQALNPARQAYEQAWQAYEKEINALHTKECPNCPWDGHTIFAVRPRGRAE